MKHRREKRFRPRNKFPFLQVLEFELECLGLFTCNPQNVCYRRFVGDDKTLMLCNEGNIVGTDHDRTVVHIWRRDFEQSTFGVGDKDASKSFVVVPMLVRIDLGTDGKPWENSALIYQEYGGIIQQGCLPVATSCRDKYLCWDNADTSSSAIVLEDKEHLSPEQGRD
jgi:hypothetical protein